MRTVLLGLAGLVLLAHAGQAQQIQEPDFHPTVAEPAYEPASGPRVAIDAGHDNLHTVDGRYKAFADLLRQDGYRVAGLTDAFATESLRQVDILVIANATDTSGAEPEAQSAFTDEEVAAVERWVEDGGSLMLIVDHADWPAANRTLAERFGIDFRNAYAYDGPDGAREGSLIYRKADGSLAEHAATEGVESVADFLGSAFRIDGEHVPLSV